MAVAIATSERQKISQQYSNFRSFLRIIPCLKMDASNKAQEDTVSVGFTSSGDDDMSSEETWSDKLVKSDPSGFLCKIDHDYLRDKFHWTDIEQRYNFTRFCQASHTLVDNFADSPRAFKGGEDVLELEAHMLYGLLHARYIMTDAGCTVMLSKYQTKDFGVCPREGCQQQPVLPIGVSDEPGVDSVKIYCPKCRDVYQPCKEGTERLDGAFFGTGFPHHFFMIYAELRPGPCFPRQIDAVPLGTSNPFSYPISGDREMSQVQASSPAGALNQGQGDVSMGAVSN